jgi:hypothetical protein
VPGQLLGCLGVNSPSRQVADESVPQTVEIGYAPRIISIGKASRLHILAKHGSGVVTIGGDAEYLGSRSQQR